MPIDNGAKPSGQVGSGGASSGGSASQMGSGGAPLPILHNCIRTEYDVAQAAILIKERDELADMRQAVANNIGPYARGIGDRTRRPSLSITNDVGLAAIVYLPRWITQWIEVGLEDRLTTIRKELRDKYGLEQ